MKLTFSKYLKLVSGDSTRHGIKTRSECFNCFCKNIGFRYSAILRTTLFLKGRLWFYPLYIFFRIIHARMSVKYGISIPYNTKIGPGLYIGHFGGIVVNHQITIGKNCNINHGVTIGVAYGGKRPGIPLIKNNVFFGSGCKVFGGIIIEDDVAIGANCVVTKTLPKAAVAVGVPGEILSYNGSSAYVVNKV